MPPDQVKAWLADRQGAIVGRDLADALRLEDRRPDSASRARSGSPKQGTTWEFNIVGIYDGDDGVDKTQFFFRYDYLDENRARATARSAGTSSRSPTRRRRSEMARDVRRDVRELVGRDEDHDREGLRRGLRQADRRHRRDHDRHSRRPCSSRFCWSPPTRWRSRCASARASWRCSRRSGSPNGRSWRWCSPSRCSSRSSAGGSASALAWLIVQRGDPTSGMLPIFVLPARDVAIGVGLMVAAGPRRRRAAGDRGDAAADHRRAEEDLTMFGWIAQTLAVTPLNLRTIPQRLSSSRVAIVGIAGVVVVFVSVLSIAAGFTAAMHGSGSPDRALVMRSGADSEMTSGLGGRGGRHHQAGARHPARRPDGRWRRPSSSSSSTCRSGRRPTRRPTCRCAASSRQRMHVRDEVSIVEGRMFEFGTNEVDRRPRRERAVRGPDGRRHGRVRPEHAGRSSASSKPDGGVAETEIWCDARVLQGAYRRGNTYQSVLARLDSPASFDTFQRLADVESAAERAGPARERVLRRAVAGADAAHPDGRLRHRRR